LKSIFVAAAMTVGALVLPATAAVAATAAPALTCGAHVTYGSWVYTTDNNHQRKWTWTYYNCSLTTRVKVNVGNGPDSGCYTLNQYASATKSFYEVENAGLHFVTYNGTIGC
jgi:fatty acid desaturase